MVKRFVFSVLLVVVLAFSVSALDVADRIESFYVAVNEEEWLPCNPSVDPSMLGTGDTYTASYLSILVPVNLPADYVVLRMDLALTSASFGTLIFDYGLFSSGKYVKVGDCSGRMLSNDLVSAGSKKTLCRSFRIDTSGISPTPGSYFVRLTWSSPSLKLVLRDSSNSDLSFSADPNSISATHSMQIPAISVSGVSTDKLSGSLVGDLGISAGAFAVSGSSTITKSVINNTVKPMLDGTIRTYYDATHYHDQIYSQYSTPKLGVTVNGDIVSSLALKNKSKIAGSISGSISLSGTGDLTLTTSKTPMTYYVVNPSYSGSVSGTAYSAVRPITLSAVRTSDDSEAVAELKKANTTLTTMKTTLSGMSKNLQTITDDYTARENAGDEIGGAATGTDVSSGTSGLTSGVSSIKDGIAGLPSFSTIMKPATAYISFLTLPVAALFDFGNGYLLYIATAMVLLSVIFFIIRRMGGAD